MKTFFQFILEAKHEMYGNYTHDWGLIHPHTGKLISGQNHPTARDHGELKSELLKKNPNIHGLHYAEYAHVSHENGTLHTRSFHPEAHRGLKKALKKLPVASNYTHVGNNGEHEFKNEKTFHNYVNGL